MTGLPSFIDLMSTLGLDGNTKPSSCISRSRSGSCSSVSSFGSSNRDPSPVSPTFNLSSDAFPRDLDVDRRHTSTRSRAARYTPYTPTSTLAKQSSTSSLVVSNEDPKGESRSSPSKSSSSPSRRRPSPLQFSKNGREDPASTPISSYLRRKTPQNSPTVATFTQRDPVERPETITLPSLISLQ
ncbi:hypothetical protein V8B97DRAFT_1924730 [Scleroderma yunnanense]